MTKVDVEMIAIIKPDLSESENSHHRSNFLFNLRWTKSKSYIILKGYPNSKNFISGQIIEIVQSKLRYSLWNYEFY